MSVQFGRWNLDGRPVDQAYLDGVKAAISGYGPDGGSSYTQDSTAILYYAFHTTKEAGRERQPHILPSGAVMTWDGRLDNRFELINELAEGLESDPTDVQIVASAYERWGTACFAKFLGDWALAIWKSSSRQLILSRDFVGVRQLYYRIGKDNFTWSTILDPLVLCGNEKPKLSEEYVAGWLGFYPAAHLSPYADIYAVAPSKFVVVGAEGCSLTQYWDFDSKKNTLYSTDGEYDEHFRTVFRQAVLRRLRSSNPILAELSGGMDSSSIVCMADQIQTFSGDRLPSVDTISLYNKSEPNWDDHSYFTRVEEKRKRTGYHIDLASQALLTLDRSLHFEATPACTAVGVVNTAKEQFDRCVKSGNYRVLLSGIGGDESMGGVPTPTPELQDLLTRLRVKQLTRRLKEWALAQRTPWPHLLWEAVREFLPQSFSRIPKSKHPAPWLTPDFVRRNMRALLGYEPRFRFFGPLPTFQANVLTLDHLRRQISCSAPSYDPPLEKRYPFLDRDLLEFIYSVPRDQLTRPGRRRCLMRRALAGIVPSEILERKRKAYVVRSPRATITREWQVFENLCRGMSSAALGIVDEAVFSTSLLKVRNTEQVPLVRIMRTAVAEAWLRHLADAGICLAASQTSEASASDFYAIFSLNKLKSKGGEL